MTVWLGLPNDRNKILAKGLSFTIGDDASVFFYAELDNNICVRIAILLSADSEIFRRLVGVVVDYGFSANRTTTISTCGDCENENRYWRKNYSPGNRQRNATGDSHQPIHLVVLSPSDLTWCSQSDCHQLNGIPIPVHLFHHDYHHVMSACANDHFEYV